MATRKQIEKQYSAALEKSSARRGLIQALYALSNDPTLQGADLIKYDGYRGKKPSGTQINLAKRLLGIASGTSKRPGRKKRAAGRRGGPRKKHSSGTADASALLKEAMRTLDAIVARADEERAAAEKRYKEEVKRIEAESAEARRKLKQLKTAAAAF